MKKIILSFIVFFLLFSCSKKEQYYGKWIGVHGFHFIEIQQDSITISLYGDQWKTYPVTIKNNNLTFLDHTFETSISKERFIFNGVEFKKDTTTRSLNTKLPELTAYRFQEPDPNERLVHIRYGKVPNSDEFKLQFTDVDADFEELIDYFYGDTHSEHVIKRVLFVCDENAKMEDVALLFYEMVRINAIKYYTVNHVEHEVVDTKIQQKYITHRHVITPIHTVTDKQQVGKKMNTIKYTYIYNESFLKDFKLKKTQYLLIVNNEFYIGKEKYSLEAFTKKVDSIILNNSQLVTLFDSKSNYKHYSILNAIINDAYYKRYNPEAKQKYNKPYEQLNGDEKRIVRRLHPRINIENVSIPHFLSLEESSGEDIEFLYKNVKEQIPEAYFEQLE